MPISQAKPCPKCNISHTKSGRFCSRHCANSRGSYPELHKQNISKGLQKYHKTRLIKPKILSTFTCKVCQSNFLYKHKRQTCSNKCVAILCSKGGKKSASMRIIRSKDEIELFILCENYFNHVTNNDPIAEGWDADILIHDTKTAVLWNGIWHRQQLSYQNHSLVQVQNRDKLKIEAFTRMNWTVIIFNDNEISPNEAFAKLVHLARLSLTSKLL